MRLVADVGGTNSRLALSHAGIILPGSTQSFANADWRRLDDIIQAYLGQNLGARPTEMVVAVAGPVRGDRAVLTNRNWSVETGKLADRFAIEKVHLFNDLTALGFSVPHLGIGQATQINQGVALPSKVAQSLVVGVGTGFNVSPVFQNGDAVVCPAVEAGHVTLPLGIVKQLQRLDLDADQYPTVEDLFSGRGFADFCQHISGEKSLSGPAAIAAYGTPDAARISFAVDEYAALLGGLARDLSLAYLPMSGLYFAGSVARSVLGRATKKFVDVLQKPCKILQKEALPVFVVSDDNAALTGCAAYNIA